MTIATEQNDATANVTPVILPIAKTILPYFLPLITLASSLNENRPANRSFLNTTHNHPI